MELKFDTKFLIENNINPNQILILTSIKENKRKDLKHLGEGLTEDPFLYDFNRLVERDLTIGSLYTTSELTEKGKNLIEGKNQFSELLEKFPVSVIRKDGTKDYLRTDKKKAERLYKRITRNRKDIHEHILACLTFELKERRLNNNMMWMKKMPNWLSSSEWENWNEKIKENELNDIFGEEDDYGTGVE